MAQEINLEKEMREILDEYALQVSTATRQAVSDTAKETTRKLKKASPKRPKGGKYANGWAYKVKSGYGRFVRNSLRQKAYIPTRASVGERSSDAERQKRWASTTHQAY